MKTFYVFLIVISCIFPLNGQNYEIEAFLKDSISLRQLQYPKSVSRFYSQLQYQSAWTNSPEENEQPKTAILLLEDAYKYGLSVPNYQRPGFSFSKFKTARDFTSISARESARFDIYLTDALIAFIKDLHYGKYNPEYARSNFDTYNVEGFSAVETLTSARRQNDFRNALLEVQPKLKAYVDLQNYLATLYTSGNTPTSETEVTKIIINMERLRWINMKSPSYVLVNIPSYTLAFHRGNTVTDFKVIVGKPSTKSPLLKSNIDYFTTAPDWNVPQSIFLNEMLPKILKNRRYLSDNHYSLYDKNGNKIKASALSRSNARNYRVRQSPGSFNALGAIVFRFQNPYGVYLHDTSQRKLFNNKERALSHGCIRLENAKKFATLLLENDKSAYEIPTLEKAMTNFTRKDFVLKQPVPIIITYLTCIIQDGKPVVYKDIYHFDKTLETQLKR